MTSLSHTAKRQTVWLQNLFTRTLLWQLFREMTKSYSVIDFKLQIFLAVDWSRCLWMAEFEIPAGLVGQGDDAP